MKSSAKLSLRFDENLLQKELDLTVTEWTKHFNTGYYSGDWSGIVLRGPAETSHQLSPGSAGTVEYADSPLLEELPYTRKALDMIEAPKTSVRYLKLTPGSSIKAHKDYDLIFWDGYVRLHIPVLTNEQVEFTVDGESVAMKAGECWFADFSKEHSVVNRGTADRVHLVVDCRVNEWLLSLFESEGVLERGEQAPDQFSQFDYATKLQVAQHLELLGTDFSLQMAAAIRKDFE